jgi:hypothetical protein
MLGFNETGFNACAFNAEDECYLPESFWELFLNPETTNTLVARGIGPDILPNVMLPGQQYQLERTADGIFGSTRFRTPAAIAFDGLGG